MDCCQKGEQQEKGWKARTWILMKDEAMYFSEGFILSNFNIIDAFK